MIVKLFLNENNYKGESVLFVDGAGKGIPGRESTGTSTWQSKTTWRHLEDCLSSLIWQKQGACYGLRKVLAKHKKNRKVIKGQIVVGILCSTKILRFPRGSHKMVLKQGNNMSIFYVLLMYCWLLPQYGGWNKRFQD